MPCIYKYVWQSNDVEINTRILDEMCLKFNQIKLNTPIC